MSQVLVRNLAPSTLARLKRHARARGRSLQSELKSLLESAANAVTMEEARAEAARIRARLAGRIQGDSTDLIREDRER